MQKIVKTKGRVLGVKDLSSTAREIRFLLQDEIDFLAGSFLNFFIEVDGEKIRRAYSIASDPADKKEISIAVRRVPNGKMSQIFWSENILGQEFEIVGPLGLNTVDKMNNSKAYLFAFGIGVSVIKGVLYSLLKKDGLEKIFILTANLNEEEILYKDFFDKVVKENLGKVEVKYVLSEPKDKNYPYKGYIQENISEYNFSNSDIYICGRESHCDSLEKEIKKRGGDNLNFLVEAFH